MRGIPPPAPVLAFLAAALLPAACSESGPAGDPAHPLHYLQSPERFTHPSEGLRHPLFGDGQQAQRLLVRRDHTANQAAYIVATLTMHGVCAEAAGLVTGPGAKPGPRARRANEQCRTGTPDPEALRLARATIRDRGYPLAWARANDLLSVAKLRARLGRPGEPGAGGTTGE